MKLVNNIKDLGVTLNDLYCAKKQVNVHLSDSPHVYSLILKDRNGFDCKISSFGANLYTRTSKGVRFAKYNTLGILQREVKKQIKRAISDGTVQFSLSNEVYTF
jgi:hypothetical protein